MSTGVEDLPEWRRYSSLSQLNSSGAPSSQRFGNLRQVGTLPGFGPRALSITSLFPRDPQASSISYMSQTQGPGGDLGDSQGLTLVKKPGGQIFVASTYFLDRLNPPVPANNEALSPSRGPLLSAIAKTTTAMDAITASMRLAKPLQDEEEKEEEETVGIQRGATSVKKFFRQQRNKLFQEDNNRSMSLSLRGGEKRGSFRQTPAGTANQRDGPAERAQSSMSGGVLPHSSSLHSSTRAATPSMKLEAVKLPEHLAVDRKKRREMNKVFESLSIEQLMPCDTTAEENVEHVRQREKTRNNVVNSVFRPSCRLLESFWSHHHIGKDEQRRFGKAHFDLATHENYITVSREVSKYTKRNDFEGGLLRLVNLREIYVRKLLALAKNPSLLDATNTSVQESVVVDIFNGVMLMRHVACLIVDLVYAQRGEDSAAAPLLWEGQNYLVKMQDDLSPLGETNLAILLPKFQFHANPMVLPSEYFSHSDPKLVGGAGPKSGGTSSKASNAGSLRKNQQTSHSGPSVSPSAALRSQQQQQQQSPSSRKMGPGNATATAEGAPIFSSAHGSKGPRVLVVQDGEEVKRPGGLSLRQEYFSRMAKKEFIESRKVEMDRTNVYQYPASVYQLKSRPCWEVSGEILARSLDPRICVHHSPYDERVEFYRMQFGMERAPPSLTIEQPEAVLDTNTHSFKMTAPVPNYTYSELHRREVLIFGESRVVRTINVRRKLRRGLLKLRIAFRGFTSKLFAMRAEHARKAVRDVDSMVAASCGFMEWVAEHAPHWLKEIEGELDRTSCEEMIMYGADSDDW